MYVSHEKLTSDGWRVGSELVTMYVKRSRLAVDFQRLTAFPPLFLFGLISSWIAGPWIRLPESGRRSPALLASGLIGVAAMPLGLHHESWIVNPVACLMDPES